MLTGNLVRVRHARNKLIPQYIDEQDPRLRETAEQLLTLFRTLQGSTRGEMEEEVVNTIGDNPTTLVEQGLAKLLEDRCEFDVESSHPPDELREAVFRLAASQRASSGFDRAKVLGDVAGTLQVTAEEIERGLFADLKMEQRVISFQDFTVEQLLQRYNVALAQAILLRATKVTVSIARETPQRYRKLFRAVKFHRLICEFAKSGTDEYTLTLDGPLSLFSATQKYGVQLANFLPTLLHCKQFGLKAAVRWGAQKKEKEFFLESGDGLKSHLTDCGDYVPKELMMFAESFRKQIDDWEIVEETELLLAGNSVWPPDFALVHRPTQKRVYLEILGFWRKTEVDKHYRQLRKELKEPFLLAVSDQFNVDEEEGDTLKGIYRFKRTPLPEEVARLALEAISR